MISGMAKIPVAVSDFDTLRNGNYVYIDKSIWVWHLCQLKTGFILTRPRGMGKSLLLTSIRDYLRGRKQLFQGLAINKIEVEWKTRKVLCLNFGDVNQRGIENVLTEQIKDMEVSLNCCCQGTIIERLQYALQFDKEAVLLVDDWDRLEGEQGEIIQEIIMSAPSIFKGIVCEGAAPTGGQMVNISDNSLCAHVCGFTESELSEGFEEALMRMADESCVTFGEVCDKLVEVYSGYRFSFDFSKECVMNPLSIVHALSNNSMASHWFKLNNHRVLSNIIKAKDYDLSRLLQPCTVRNLHQLQYPLRQLYDGGYLTFKCEGSSQVLDFPSQDVRLAAINWVIQNTPKNHPYIDSDRLFVALMSELLY